MIEVNRVLCPTDLSEASGRAFDYAIDFARWYEAQLTVLHVVPPLPVMLGATGALPPPDEDAERRAALARFVADRVPAGGPEVEVDFSDASLHAVELAFSLAQEADARVLLLHVVEALPPPVPPLAPAGPAVAGYLRDLEADAAGRLRRVVPAGASEWCEPEARVACGKPWREILREAIEHEAGLIVLGVHGQGPLDRLLFGSTATGVVRHAGCPVLVARATRAAEERPGG